MNRLFGLQHRGVGSGDHSIGLNSIRMLLLIIFYMG